MIFSNIFDKFAYVHVAFAEVGCFGLHNVPGSGIRQHVASYYIICNKVNANCIDIFFSRISFFIYKKFSYQANNNRVDIPIHCRGPKKITYVRVCVAFPLIHLYLGERMVTLSIPLIFHVYSSACEDKHIHSSANRIKRFTSITLRVVVLLFTTRR